MIFQTKLESHSMKITTEYILNKNTCITYTDGKGLQITDRVLERLIYARSQSITAMHKSTEKRMCKKLFKNCIAHDKDRGFKR